MSLKKSVGFSGISTAKAALGTFIEIQGKPLGEHPRVVRFMTGIARQLPRQPRYSEIWDPTQVIEFFKAWSPAKILNFFQLSVKTAVLLLLVTGQRPQILSHLSLDLMVRKKGVFKFFITQNLKHSRGNQAATEIVLHNFPADKRVCIVNYLSAYIQRTEPIRKSQQLFITTTRPYGPASLQTLTRWVKFGLQKAGINVTRFSAGSTRAAASNAALRAGVPIQTILARAAWATESTFQKWYRKPLVNQSPDFQTAVLSRK